VQPRVYELARELGITSTKVLDRLAEMGVQVQSPSSYVETGIATRVKESFGQYAAAAEAGATTPRQSTWNANPVKPPTHPDWRFNLNRLKQSFSVVEEEQLSIPVDRGLSGCP
jgi:Translation initiation factor IF-2, N-terminal region